MTVQLQIIPEAEKPLLAQLMELYLYDFSAYSHEDVNEYGFYGYRYMDDYWIEEGRYPYLIRADGRIAGFALICPHCEYRKEPEARCVGEFFVMRKYRGMGVGTEAAVRLFDSHQGLWEVCYWNNNLPARSFWKKTVEKYTNGRYEICGTEQDKQMGFLFQNM